MPGLIDLLINAESKSERTAVQKILVSIARGIEDPQKRSEQILAKYANASAESKGNLLRAMGKLGGRKAFTKVVQETRSINETIKDAAIRALADWPDVSAAEELLSLAEKSEELKYNVVTLGGYIRVVGESSLDS